jgi:membrane associated rhomboid family serine protease
MRYVTAVIAFLLMFAIGFVLGGWFLMPHLPPVPDHPVTVFEAEYWTTNWAGALFGLVFGFLSARSTLKRKPRSTSG